jgi:hypothetical protein
MSDAITQQIKTIPLKHDIVNYNDILNNSQSRKQTIHNKKKSSKKVKNK